MDTERIRHVAPGATVVVTGATGRLGSALCRHLVTHGHAARALVRDRGAAAARLRRLVHVGTVDVFEAVAEELAPGGAG